MTFAHGLSAPTNRRSDVDIGRTDASLRSKVKMSGFGAFAYHHHHHHYHHQQQQREYIPQISINLFIISLIFFILSHYSRQCFIMQM